MTSAGFARVQNTEIWYELAGEGPALVFVHAGIADGRMWDDQVAVFAASYRGLRYDRRGFGKTQMAGGPFSHHRDLRALMDHLGIERAALIGCSQGAKTSLDFALETPHRAAALVLVAPALSGFVFAGSEPPQAAEIDAAEQAGDIDRVNELELQIWVDGPRRTPGQVDPRLREKVREMNRIALQTPEGLGEELELEPPAAGRLGEIHVPTLVVAGDLDTPRTLAAADYLSAQIAGARKVVIPGTAHLPNMEQPEVFNRAVLAFLNALALD